MCSVFIASGAFAAKDLMVYFPYEEIDNGIVPDMSGNGYDGTVNGDITLVDGKFGEAAKFTSGSFLDLHGEDIPAGEAPTDVFTICAWVKCENTGGDQAIFNARASDGTWLIHPQLNGNGQYRFTLRGYGSNKICDIKTGTVTWDEWTHYAGTYDKATGKVTLYINGEVIAESDALADVDIAGDWDVGARVGYNIDNARPFTGVMDDFSIWRKVLTQDEIKDVMNNGPNSSVIAPVITAVSPNDKLASLWGQIKK